MMSLKLTQVQANCAQLVQKARMAPGIPTAWLPISFPMAHIEIESGFEPNIKAGDFATTGSEGLMQVARATVSDVAVRFPSVGILNLPQTDPYTSILTGMLYLWMCREYLIPIFGAPLLYKHICVAYNEGPGNAGRSIPDNSYYFKWLSAQQRFSFLDAPAAMV